MKRALLFLLLSGCAMSKPAEPVSVPPPISDEPNAVDAYVVRQQQLLADLERPQADAKPRACEDRCTLVANVCELSGRICAITARHDGDDAMRAACDDALDRCSRARARTADCTCAAPR